MARIAAMVSSSWRAAGRRSGGHLIGQRGVAQNMALGGFQQDQHRLIKIVLRMLSGQLFISATSAARPFSAGGDSR
jgi:hypothetical protein